MNNNIKKEIIKSIVRFGFSYRELWDVLDNDNAYWVTYRNCMKKLYAFVRTDLYLRDIDTKDITDIDICNVFHDNHAYISLLIKCGSSVNVSHDY